MTLPEAPKPPSSKRRITAFTLTLVVGGLIAGCVAFAYSFTLLVTAPQNRASSVAGAEIVRGIVPKPVASTPAPTVKAASGLLIDPASGYVLWQSNPSAIRPLASLTKLVTASVFLAATPTLDATFTIPANFDQDGITDNVEPGTAVSKLQVPVGSRVTYHDLLFASLIGSANNAAIALGTIVGPDVVDRMNLYAAFHGAPTASFTEPSGLNPKNTGSAHDVALLAHAAFSQSLVAEATSLQSYTVQTGGRPTRVVSTDKLLGQDGYAITAGKTGYLREAGYNVALQATSQGNDLLLVLLGEPTSADRFADADALLRWAFGSFTWASATE